MVWGQGPNTSHYGTSFWLFLASVPLSGWSLCCGCKPEGGAGAFPLKPGSWAPSLHFTPTQQQQEEPSGFSEIRGFSTVIIFPIPGKFRSFQSRIQRLLCKLMPLFAVLSGQSNKDWGICFSYRRQRAQTQQSALSTLLVQWNFLLSPPFGMKLYEIFFMGLLMFLIVW